MERGREEGVSDQSNRYISMSTTTQRRTRYSHPVVVIAVETAVIAKDEMEREIKT